MLVNPRTEQMMVLSRTAALFWDSLRKGWDVSRFEEEMLNEYEAGQSRLRSE